MKQALGRTWLRRPELLAAVELDGEQSSLLAEYQADWLAQGNSAGSGTTGTDETGADETDGNEGK